MNLDAILAISGLRPVIDLPASPKGQDFAAVMDAHTSRSDKSALVSAQTEQDADPAAPMAPQDTDQDTVATMGSLACFQRVDCPASSVPDTRQQGNLPEQTAQADHYGLAGALAMGAPDVADVVKPDLLSGRAAAWGGVPVLQSRIMVMLTPRVDMGEKVTPSLFGAEMDISAQGEGLRRVERQIISIIKDASDANGLLVMDYSGPSGKGAALAREAGTDLAADGIGASADVSFAHVQSLRVLVDAGPALERAQNFVDAKAVGTELQQLQGLLPSSPLPFLSAAMGHLLMQTLPATRVPVDRSDEDLLSSVDPTTPIIGPGASLAHDPSARNDLLPVTRLPQAVMPDLRDSLLAALSVGNGQIELDTGPEALGKLKLSVQLVDGVMQVTLLSGRPDALDMLRRSLGLLMRDLSQHGFDTFTLRLGSSLSQADIVVVYSGATPTGQSAKVVSGRTGSAWIDKRL
jgi:hypothetical protein